MHQNCMEIASAKFYLLQCVECGKINYSGWVGGWVGGRVGGRVGGSAGIKANSAFNSVEVEAELGKNDVDV